MLRRSLADPPPTHASTHGSIRLLLWEERGKLFGKAWRGRAQRPYAHYVFRSDEERKRWADQQIEAGEAAVQHARARKEALRRDVIAMSAKLRVGSLLATSWGYDQTNVDFYEVIARTPGTATVRQIAATLRETGFMAGKVTPRPGVYVGPPMTKRIQGCGVRVDSHLATPTEPGAEHYCSWYA